MDVERIPNLTNLKIEHCIDEAGAGEKTEWLDFSKINYTDKREVPLSWKCLQSFDEACDWYAKEMDGKYHPAIIPYLVKKSIEPAMVRVKKKKTRNKKLRFSFFRRFGKFNIKFK